MRTLLIALLAVGISGCVVHVHKDPNAPAANPAPKPAEPPPPPPPPPAPSGKTESASYMLKYKQRVPDVYEGIKKACAKMNFRITKADTPGDDNWNIRGYHGGGGYDLHIYMNRHDHKSRTTVTVSSARYDQVHCREWTRRLHAEIGKAIDEQGSD
jgi:hypothetical protein